MSPERKRRQTTDSSDGLATAHWQITSAISGQQQTPHKSVKIVSPQLKFVNLTKRISYGTRNANEERSIRAHVMHDFLRQRTQKATPHKPAVTAWSMLDNLNRFRVSPRKTRFSRRRLVLTGSSNADAANNQMSTLRRIEPKALTSPSHPSLHVARSSSSSRKSSISDGSTIPGAYYLSPNLITNLLGDAGRRDPFAKLPISASAAIHEMLDYCKHFLVFRQHFVLSM